MKKLLLTIGILLVGVITFAQPTGVNKKWTFPDLIEVPKLLVGDATSNTVITIDSVGYKGVSYQAYDGATEINPANTIKVYNVMDYGAHADGATDDYAHIQACIDAVPATGGIVYFPEGVYAVSAGLHTNYPITFRGVPSKRYTTSGGTDYEAGSTLKSTGSGIALLTIESSSTTAVNHRGAVVQDLNFWDEAGVNDTLLTIRMMNRGRVMNCSFATAAVGMYIDADVEDASWLQLDFNDFFHNTVGIELNQDPTSAGVPIVNIVGGMFLVRDHQVGIHGDKPAYTTISGLKMDIQGHQNYGIHFEAGSNISITDVKFESNATDSTGICISFVHGSLSGIGIAGTDYGTGVYIQKGNSPNDPNLGTSIVNSSFSGLDYGIHANDTTGCINIANCDFKPQINIAAIRFDKGSNNNHVTNTRIGNLFSSAGGIVDYGSTSFYTNISYANGGARKNYNIIPQLSGALTDNAPTDTEIDTRTGLTPATAGVGYKVTIKDTNGTGLLYYVESDGTNWQFIPMIIAVDP